MNLQRNLLQSSASDFTGTYSEAIGEAVCQYYNYINFLKNVCLQRSSGSSRNQAVNLFQFIPYLGIPGIVAKASIREKKIIVENYLDII